MWNYADTHTYWSVEENRAKLHRVWHNSHYHEMGKDESENKGPNWRERGYPYAPGKEQPDRFSEEVQRGLGQTFLSDLWKERATKGR